MYEACLNLSVVDKGNSNDIMGLDCFSSIAVRNENFVNHSVVCAVNAPAVGVPDYGRHLPLILSIPLSSSLPLAEGLR
jgi:hypothetical protein